MRFEQFLRRSADRFPDKTALVASGKLLTYSQLDNLSDELAQGLVERGIRRGDRVVLFLDNSAEAVVSIFAVLKAGAVFSPVNPSTKADKLAFKLVVQTPTGERREARMPLSTRPLSPPPT